MTPNPLGLTELANRHDVLKLVDWLDRPDTFDAGNLRDFGNLRIVFPPTRELRSYLVHGDQNSNEARHAK